MFGLALKPGKVEWVDLEPEVCLRISNAVLYNHPKNKRARIVLEICGDPDNEDGEDGENEEKSVAVAVLTSFNDNMPLDVFINSKMGLRIRGKDCKGAVVHVTGDLIPPEYPEDVPIPMDMDDFLGQVLEEEPDSDDDDEDSDDDDGIVDNKDMSKSSKAAGKNDDDDDDDDKDSEGDDDCEVKNAGDDKDESIEIEKEEKKDPAKDKVKKGQDKKRKLETEQPKAKKSKTANPIVKLKSGLQYQDMISGTGKQCKAGRNVAVQYVLRLENGKVVDKAERKRPFKFRLGIGECIKGFDQGLNGMREGGERHLIVPPHLGYGDQKLPGIPANSTLYFDIVLLKAF